MKLNYAIAQHSGTEQPEGTDHLSVIYGGDIIEAGSEIQKSGLSSNKSGLLFSLCDGGSENLKAMESAESCNSEISTLLSDLTDVSSYDENDAKSKLGEGLKRANELLLQLAETEDDATELLSSIGTVWMCQNYAIFSHVGNVRIYRFTDNVLELLTDDHTEAWALVEEGKITPDKVINYPGNKNLTQILGGKGKQHPEIMIEMTKVESGDCFFICTDGVSHHLNDRAFEELLNGMIDHEGLLSDDVASSIAKLAFEKSEGKEHASVIAIQAFPKASRWTEIIQELDMTTV